jgi:chorismate-pyruvate lyase
VIRRRVILQGRHSGRFLAWADSVIGIERLPGAMGTALVDDGGGLGRILLDSRVETRRECLWYGRDRPTEVPPQVARLWSGDFLVRSYRVIGAGRPIMLITERFPL